MTATHTAPAAALEVAQLHPDALDIGENVRDSVDLAQTPDFVESIRENGVLEAISAVRTADGTIVVRDGQRRTLAARETGLTSIPVVIYPDTAGSDKARAVDRIGKQITANRHREGLTAAQHTRGVAQMLEFGASITKVSKTLAMDKKDVKAQAAVGKAEAARAALDAGQLDLAHAAVVAEFEEAGDTEAVEKLLTTRSYDFDHVAERLRGLREEREAYARAAAPFEEKGFTILPHDHISFGEDVPSPSDLVTTDGDEVTPDMIDAAPQFWAVFLGLNDAFFDKATGERVDYDDVDWDTEDDDSAVPDEGLRHANTVDYRPEYLPEYWCIDQEGAGLEPRPIIDAVPAAAGGSGNGPAEAARAVREQEAKDKQERRRVRELNKQAEAATTVRREFLRTTLLARKTPPKTAAAYVATTLARDPGLISEYKAAESLGELLGFKGYYPGRELAEQVAKASEARAQVLLLALVIAAQESRMVKDAWRSKPKNADQYLSFLMEQGYTLSAVEEIITGQLTFDEVAID
ncbi:MULTISPECIES: ParB/RepB/Spo0J family partition protein [Rhodococcus]|uniref:ParB/RepB/Spo0J family partition protein n=1 Tax=Rhodococcus TaxID=1827 RepID=UPI001C5F6D47|nr:MULTISPECIES: ParB N-terminal domain-containing protein [Rhodococcus]MBW4818134.1 ParB N-terminal domain-containing protein [Rhodococcus qingshengii]MCJ0905978.1 ParB N-terminal domain-containing protein [Rhodococcus sp. ARC_M6]